MDDESKPIRDPARAVLARYRRHRKRIAHVEEIPAQEAHYASTAPPLDSRVLEALPPAFRFYDHQARAIGSALAGRNVVIATPTASGKSICYQLPVLDAIARDPTARSIFLFPTKALAHDQRRAFRKLTSKVPYKVVDAPYDGDTPNPEREAIRRGGATQVLFTNPEMVNQSLLPWHASAWKWLFRSLRFVVVDELHTYRGVFGSHVANILRRLRRIARHHGASPVFVCSSATIGNARELAEMLCGGPFELVDADTSPSGPRTVVFWNPPIKRDDGIGPQRGKAYVDSVHAFVESVRAGARVIDFARSRKLTELIFRNARAKLSAGENARDAARILSYRAGYLPKQRREIESKLANGDLLGVVATSALELGIDIGHLDAAIITGFPGTIASFWQQAGRAGRSGRPSIVTYVADEDALNQFWMANPREFFKRPSESAIVNPGNPYVLDPHVASALQELPAKDGADENLGAGFVAACERLAAAGLVEKRTGLWRWVGPYSPQHRINVRSISNDTFALVDLRGRAIGDRMEDSRAYRELHPGAVYLHLGESFVVQDLDLEGRRAVLATEDVDYRTEPLTETEIEVDREIQSKQQGAMMVRHGDVRVTQRVTGFVRLDAEGEALNEEALTLPSTTLRTKALWFELDEDLTSKVGAKGFEVGDALHATEHALISLTPLIAMCDRWDLGGVSYESHPQTSRPSLFIYDGFPGGVGITEADYERIEELVAMTRRLVADCACKEGCPGCVQSPKCGNRNKHLSKLGGLAVLEMLEGRNGT